MNSVETRFKELNFLEILPNLFMINPHAFIGKGSYREIKTINLIVFHLEINQLKSSIFSSPLLK